MHGDDMAEHDSIRAIYHRFAQDEARHRSPLYEALALGVARDAGVIALLASMPPVKRQPNLLLAAVRHVAGVAADWPTFRESVLSRWPEIRAVMLSHATQTNEPGRCAALLPVLARLPQPLALIEVGASAGLCLLPDRYAYEYGTHSVWPVGADAHTPVFPCQASLDTPLPNELPRIVWRAGLDIAPLDVTNAQHMTWLEELVWPEQADRAERLKAAVRIAQFDPPRLVRGDLRTDLAELAAEAPSTATLVIFHTAVLVYVPDDEGHSAFTATVSSVCDHWVSNEAPHALPEVAARAPSSPPADRFVLAVNGAPVAWTDPHGSTLDWLPEVQGSTFSPNRSRP